MAADTVAQATNRGFISAAKEYQAGEELTFDYGLLNDAVLAFYGAKSLAACRMRRPSQLRQVAHAPAQAFPHPTAAASGGDPDPLVVAYATSLKLVPNRLRFSSVPKFLTQ